MKLVDKTIFAIAAVLFIILVVKMATENVPHPLEGDQPTWICLNGECFDGKGGYKKM